MRLTVRRPKIRLVLLFIGIVALLLIILFVVATFRHLGLPDPTGRFGVGKTHVTWHDTSRPEDSSANPNDSRELPLQIWYPSDEADGEKAAYIPNLSTISDGLKEAGEVNWVAAWALRYVRTHAYPAAPVSGTSARYPVVVFSPGNSSNLEFYSSYLEDLASHGYIVVGINHPYDVAAVELSDGTVAVIPPLGATPDQDRTASRVEVRKLDILYVLDHLGDLNAGSSVLEGRLDTGQVVAAGHSLGGIAASQACVVDSRFKGCLNLDGLQDGGPFSVRRGESIPSQAFRLITKESTWLPATQRLVESVPNASFTLIPGAEHQSFSDSPLFGPTLNPFKTSAGNTNGLVRASILEFIRATLPIR